MLLLNFHFNKKIVILRQKLLKLVALLIEIKNYRETMFVIRITSILRGSLEE